MPAEIELYYPGKINLKVNFPSAWDDLTEKELLFVANVLLVQTKDDATESMPTILLYLLKSRIPASAMRLVHAMEMEQLAIDLLPLLDFIVTKNDRQAIPEPIRQGIKTFICRPFDEITCGEYEDAEFAAHKFAEEPKAEHLATLAAILFKPKNIEYIRYNSRSDTYITYNVENRTKHFLKLKPQHLYSIFIWYAGCRSQLRLIFHDLYEGGKKNGEPDPMVFTNTIHAGAGQKNGTRTQIRRMKLYEFLYDCNQEAIKAKELEAMYSKTN